jgi:hypothetical protein
LAVVTPAGDGDTGGDAGGLVTALAADLAGLGDISTLAGLDVPAGWPLAEQLTRAGPTVAASARTAAGQRCNRQPLRTGAPCNWA